LGEGRWPDPGFYDLMNAKVRRCEVVNDRLILFAVRERHHDAPRGQFRSIRVHADLLRRGTRRHGSSRRQVEEPMTMTTQPTPSVTGRGCGANRGGETFLRTVPSRCSHARRVWSGGWADSSHTVFASLRSSSQPRSPATAVRDRGRQARLPRRARSGGVSGLLQAHVPDRRASAGRSSSESSMLTWEQYRDWLAR
jgi:hypothetical protein